MSPAFWEGIWALKSVNEEASLGFLRYVIRNTRVWSDMLGSQWREAETGEMLHILGLIQILAVAFKDSNTYLSPLAYLCILHVHIRGASRSPVWWSSEGEGQKVH